MPEDGDKLLVVFDTPKSIRGTALLSLAHKLEPDDQWMYLPALKRVKRIASQNKSGPFLSSEFAYEDMAVQEVEKFDYRLLDTWRTLDGSRAIVVERTPADDHSGYGRQVVWVDAELQDPADRVLRSPDRLLKTLEVEGYARYAGAVLEGRSAC